MSKFELSVWFIQTFHIFPSYCQIHYNLSFQHIYSRLTYQLLKTIFKISSNNFSSQNLFFFLQWFQIETSWEQWIFIYVFSYTHTYIYIYMCVCVCVCVCVKDFKSDKINRNIFMLFFMVPKSFWPLQEIFFFLRIFKVYKGANIL